MFGTAAGLAVFLTCGCETANRDNHNYDRISAVHQDFGFEETRVPVKYNNPASKIKLAGYTPEIIELR